MMALHFSPQIQGTRSKRRIYHHIRRYCRAIDSASCDLLVHEATYLSSHQALADQHLHSTAAGAARTAKKIGAKYLALTHYSARIDVVEASVHEANQIQEGTIACQDGDRLILDEEGNLKHISAMVNQD